MIECLFMWSDGTRERRHVEMYRPVWLVPERLTPRPARLLTMGAPISLETTTFRAVRFDRQQYVYPENWQGPLQSAFALEKAPWRPARDDGERADMELWSCINCGRDFDRQPFRCGECQWTKFVLVARWVVPRVIVETIYVEAVA